MTPVPCAIYTRKSSEEGLEQGFNSLDAQREACEAYVLSQKTQGWRAMGCYDDGGFSGGNVERPGLQRLLADIAARRIKVVVVYKVDRLTRSLADFAKLVELFDAHGVSFVSVTQQFNTTSSMGRLTLNVLLSFAQFEREVTGERIRDKIAASKRKGMWMGGHAPLGYLPHERSLVIDEPQAQRVREIFERYMALGCVKRLKDELDSRGWTTPVREGRRPGGGKAFSRGHLYRLLSNPIYIGRISHKAQVYPGQHAAIIDERLWHQVQDQLKLNAQTYRDRSDAAEASALAGLLFDDLGRRLQPTHAKKGGKRYRYYYREVTAGAEPQRPLRLPAREIEGLVESELCRLLRDGHRLLELLPQATASQVQERGAFALEMAARLEGAPADRVRLLKTLLERVVVRDDAIDIEVKLRALDKAVAEGTLRLTVPAQLKRCGLGMRLVIPGRIDARSSQPDPRVMALLAKARQWFEMLRTGAVGSIGELAREVNMAGSDVTQIVYLAFMAPDLIERIAAGAQPPGLGVRRLLAASPLPLDWAEQRRVLGFEG